MSATTRLLWSAAGKPQVRAQRPRQGDAERQCWWCGELGTKAEDVAPVEVAVADSFSDAYLAQAPLSKAVCLPYGGGGLGGAAAGRAAGAEAP